jgi:YVTN family beta-propeller protein
MGQRETDDRTRGSPARPRARSANRPQRGGPASGASGEDPRESSTAANLEVYGIIPGYMRLRLNTLEGIIRPVRESDRRVTYVALGVLSLLLLSSGVVPGGRLAAPGLPSQVFSQAHAPRDFQPALDRAGPPPAGAGAHAGGGVAPGIPAFRLGTVSRASAACPTNSGINPAWLAYDAANQTFWVAASPSCVDVFTLSASGFPQNLTAAIQVGSNPFGVAVDNVTNDVFVTNPGSNNVSVISATNNTLIATVDVGTNPHGVAFDWVSNAIYVANTGSNNVTVISGTNFSVVATVAVGASPVGVAADSASREVFVANFGSANLTAISDRTNLAVASIATGNGSYGVTWDNTSNEIFVSNEQANNVSVIDAAVNSVTAAIPVVDSMQLQGLAYDPATGLVWVGAGSAFAVVINASSNALVGYAGTDPAGVAYDPANGDVCMTNTANVTFECLDFRYVSPSDPLTFHETGLPRGFPWAVSVTSSGSNATTQGSTTSNVSFGTFGWYWITYDFRIPSDQGAIATPAQGMETLTGPPLVVNVSFSPLRGFYPVSFNETGLLNGTDWSVDVGGMVNGSNGTTHGFLLANGTYHFTAGGATGYTSNPASGSITINGTGVEVPIAFVPNPNFAVFFTETGLPAGRTWSVNLSGAVESDTVRAGVPSNLTFSERNGTYSFQVGAVTGFTVDPSSGPLRVNGSASLLEVTFTAVPEAVFDVTFTETGLSSGTNWSVTLGVTTQSTSNDSIRFTEPNGTYSFVVSSPPGLTASPDFGSIMVNGSEVPQAIAFSEIPVPLSANFSYQIQYASCLRDGGVTNFVVLSALAAGRSSPYVYNWTLPTGSATTALTATTTTFGQNNTVTLVVSDSAGKSATYSAQLPMELPPCGPQPIGSIPANSLSAQDWAIVGLAVALLAVSGVAVWLGVRGKGGSGGNR